MSINKKACIQSRFSKFYSHFEKIFYYFIEMKVFSSFLLIAIVAIAIEKFVVANTFFDTNEANKKGIFKLFDQYNVEICYCLILIFYDTLQ